VFCYYAGGASCSSDVPQPIHGAAVSALKWIGQILHIYDMMEAVLKEQHNMRVFDAMVSQVSGPQQALPRDLSQAAALVQGEYATSGRSPGHCDNRTSLFTRPLRSA